MEKGIFSERDVLKMVFTEATNPASVRDVGSIKIRTLDAGLEGAGAAIVDTFSDTSTVLFTTVALPIYSASVTPSTTKTWSASVFTFDLTLANKLFTGGYIEIVLPDDVKLPEGQALTLVPGTNMDP